MCFFNTLPARANPRNPKNEIENTPQTREAKEKKLDRSHPQLHPKHLGKGVEQMPLHLIHRNHVAQFGL
jgi:hypothetical protein